MLACFSVLALLTFYAAIEAESHLGNLDPVNGLDLHYKYKKTCTVKTNGDGLDDSTNILHAFKSCNRDSRIVFQNTTYQIDKAMELTDLDNVKIELHGTLKWSDDINYWLENSLPIGPGHDQLSYPPAAYQNQTTALILGGSRLYVEGDGYGTFDGNGQAWYNFVKGESNYPNRPHAIVITATDSYFHGLRFVQPQMWTVTIVSSKRVLLEDIYVKAESDNTNPARNTDGANAIFSDQITFRRWEVHNGDDCIAMKANSTNILIEDSSFYDGNGLAIGSIGQYYGRFETASNVVARNLKMYGTKFVARIKTWTGEQNEYPPNGGGGGIGYVGNILFENIEIEGGRESPLVINQCYTNVNQANCSTSTLEVDNISYKNVVGTIISEYTAQFQCSRSQAGCEKLVFENVNFTNVDGNKTSNKIKCSNVISPEGFECD